MNSDPPEWAHRTDPSLIGDVQRFGFLSAAKVIDRYAGMVDRAIEDGRGPPVPPLPGDDGVLVDRAARLAEAYLRLVDATVALATDRGESGVSMERITLPVAGPASRVETSIWVHNPTGQAATRLHLEVTELVSPAGVSIPAMAVSIRPSVIDRLHPSTSREVRLRVDVPQEQSPGYYHGLVLTSEAPDEPIGVRLEIRPPAEDSP